MVENKVYYKNFVTMLSGNVLSQLIPLLIAPLLTRLFSPDDFAVYANYIAIASMVGIVAAGRLEYAIPISKDKRDAQNIAFTGIILTIILSLLSFVFPVFSEFFGEMYDSQELQDYLILIPAAVLSFGLLGIATNWILKLKKYNVLSTSKIFQSLFNNGCAALLGYVGWGVSGLIIGWIIGQFIGIVILFIFMEKKVNVTNYNITTIKNTVKEYRDFPLINSLHAFTDIFATQFVLFWIISYNFGLTELGLFVMMHKYVRAPIVLVTSSVSTIFYAEMGSAINNRKSAIPILKKTIFTSAAFSFPFILILIFFAPQLFEWFFGKEWQVAGVYAQRIVPILFFMFILSPISSIPILLNQQKKAYLFAALGYTATLSSLVLATYLNWEFLEALTLYSVVYGIYQLAFLYWFYILMKNPDAHNR